MYAHNTLYKLHYQVLYVQQGVDTRKDAHCVHVCCCGIQWNLSNKAATCRPVLTDFYREVAALQR